MIAITPSSAAKPSLVIESGPLPPQEIMDRDACLLEGLDPNGGPVLHFYEWNSPALTYGYFSKPEQHLNHAALAAFGIQTARRPTGGGIIFHVTDFAFSILVPACHSSYSTCPLDNYAYINTRIAKVLKGYCGSLIEPSLLQPQEGEKRSGPFCMALPTEFDLLMEGRKIGGAAQRRTRKGYLHQGSIFISFPDRNMLQAVLKNNELLQQMEQNSFCLEQIKKQPFRLMQEELKNRIKDSF
jgi:lipoate-protein ligase A